MSWCKWGHSGQHSDVLSVSSMKKCHLIDAHYTIENNKHPCRWQDTLTGAACLAELLGFNRKTLSGLVRHAEEARKWTDLSYSVASRPFDLLVFPVWSLARFPSSALLPTFLGGSPTKIEYRTRVPLF